MADNNLIDDFKCPICFEYCIQPVETNCCHKIYCRNCADKLQGTCALCRKRFNYTHSVFLERLINTLKILDNNREADPIVNSVDNKSNNYSRIASYIAYCIYSLIALVYKVSKNVIVKPISSRKNIFILSMSIIGYFIFYQNSKYSKYCEDIFDRASLF